MQFFYYICCILQFPYSKHTTNMVIPTKNMRQWKKVVADIGITAFAAGSGFNFRTVKRAIDTGRCSDKVFVACQKVSDRRQQKVKRLIAATKTEDDNN